MIRTVYFEDKAIVFTDDAAAACGEVIRPGEAGEIAFAKLLQNLKNTKCLTVLSDDAEADLGRMAAGLRCIEAGGGVATNPAGEVLMIFRNGRWDLPKGKLEAGERIEACAVREVEEECGIEALERGELLTHTYHIYSLHGEWVLKRTTWYRMRYAGAAAPAPQTAEGITEAVWVAPAAIAAQMEGSYGTIRDVMAAAGYL